MQHANDLGLNELVPSCDDDDDGGGGDLDHLADRGHYDEDKVQVWEEEGRSVDYTTRRGSVINDTF